MPSERYQNSLARRPQPVPPIWFMRQAGRYHGHYQSLRRMHSFEDLCRVPALAAEVALGPIEAFDFDVSILFSDLLFPLDALGFGLSYRPAPHLERRLDRAMLQSLPPVDAALPELRFQQDAMLETRARLPGNKSLVGFVGGCWTLFNYAVNHRHGDNALENPESLDLYQRFNETLIPLLEQNIALQLDGGAEVVYLFDTSAGNLSPEGFARWIAPTVEHFSGRFPGRLAYYAKGIGPRQQAALEPCAERLAGRGFDREWDLAQCLRQTGNGFVQGNFDQELLASNRETFRRALKAFIDPLRAMRPQERAGWVCGLGHGILPHTPEAHVSEFIETIRTTFNEH